MQRNDMLKRGAPLLLGLGVIAGSLGGSVLAQGTPVTPNTTTGQTAPGVPGAQNGPGGPRRGDHQAFLQPIATLLRMTPDELRTAQQNGQSLAQIATARNVDQNTLIQTIISSSKTRLDQEVAAGRLTQQQETDRLQRLQQEAPQMITRTGPPGGGMRGGIGTSMQAVATLLHMTPADLRTARQSGQSLAQIAAAHNVDQNTLVQTIINDQVQRLQQEVPQMVTRTGPPNRGPRGFDGPGGPGRRTGTPTTR